MAIKKETVTLSRVIMQTTSAKDAHKEARIETRSSGNPHVVCKPVAEYSVEIKKKRSK